MTWQLPSNLYDADPVQLEASEPELVSLIRREINVAGSITFARFMELALYAPGLGYYQTAGRGVGRGGDFLTAPEATPFFGLTMARQLAECWELLGRPSPFVIREYGAGIGGLAYDILAGLSEASSGAFTAAQYRLVEVSEERLAPALAAMDEVGLGDKIVPELATDRLEPVTGIVLANEVADAQPVHRLIWRNGAVRELAVAWRDGWFADVETDVSPEARMLSDRVVSLAAPFQEGDGFAVSPAAADWMAGAIDGLARGFAFVIDYGYPSAELVARDRRGGLIRGYAGHSVTDNPFLRIGRQDLTSHVDFDLLAEAAESTGARAVGLTTQASFLTALGMGELLVAMQRDPDTAMEQYLAAQAAVLRLIDPGGLGRFRVLGLAKGVTPESPLRGFREITGLM